MNHEEAVTRANKLLKHFGSGWVKEVWENFGWHLCISKDVIQIHENFLWDGIYSYTVYYNFPGKQFTAHHSNPREALRIALNDAQEFSDRINDSLDLFDKE